MSDGNAAGTTGAERGAIALFLMVAFALDWACWLVAGSRSGWAIDEFSGAWGLLLAVSMFAPLASAAIVRRVREVRVSTGWRPCLKGGVRWYLLALLVPPVLTLAGSVVYFLVTPGDFDPAAARFATAAKAQLHIGSGQVPAVMAVQVLFSVAVAPFLNTLFAIGEEVGWRGFLYPALGERMPKARATVLSGVVWGAWHAPLIAMGYNYGSDYLGFPVLGIAAMIVFCMAFGTFLCYLRERSGSIWPCALAHGSLNAVAGVGLWFSHNGYGVWGPTPLGLIGCIPTALLAVWLLVHVADGE